ncbi:hypothetical protein OD917_07320 [Flavobacterium sp. SH_e]|uniref:hypothetical protein n=1 Tax=Flavobacterium sp. SH_e TaxID=2983767 RepID=UPI0021E37F61|nr:hypothetical protein [Flavobacterium sp. SH_e]MCV2484728.1 hypothetical protein [Flavobacterium sp. SH_e]
MNTTASLFAKILTALSDRDSGLNLEHLAALVTPLPDSVAGLHTTEKNGQAALLDALIALNDGGYIALNPLTDQSRITLKGLVWIGTKGNLN